jgi:hypothetical protein
MKVLPLDTGNATRIIASVLEGPIYNQPCVPEGGYLVKHRPEREGLNVFRRRDVVHDNDLEPPL